MTLLFSHGESYSHFSIPSEAAQEAGVPEYQRHGEDENQRDICGPAFCQVYISTHSTLAAQALHYRSKFI